MKINKVILATLAASVVLPAASYAASPQEGRLFSERHHSAVIAAGAVEQIGVKLPRGAKIPKVEVLADTSDKGDKSGDWKSCNIETKRCEQSDVRIVRFHRGERDGDPEPWQELSVDVANESGETRAVKLMVTFQPQGGKDLKECRLDTDCGWSKPATE